MAYFWATRPIMGLLAALLCLAGFRLQADFTHYEWWQMALCATVTFAACSLAMLCNDYVDRYRDLSKGKRLAHDQPDHFSKMIFALCVFLGLAVGFLGETTLSVQLVALMMIVLGVYYPKSYQILLLPLLIVALCSAAPSLFGFFLNPDQPVKGITLFIVVFLSIAAREILKDIEDWPDDIGYKATLPCWLGRAEARVAAAALLLVAAVTAFWGWQDLALRWTAVLLLICGAIIWPANQSPKVGKLALDLTTALTLFGILSGILGS